MVRAQGLSYWSDNVPTKSIQFQAPQGSRSGRSTLGTKLGIWRQGSSTLCASVCDRHGFPAFRAKARIDAVDSTATGASTTSDRLRRWCLSRSARSVRIAMPTMVATVAVTTSMTVTKESFQKSHDLLQSMSFDHTQHRPCRPEFKRGCDDGMDKLRCKQRILLPGSGHE